MILNQSRVEQAAAIGAACRLHVQCKVCAVCVQNEAALRGHEPCQNHNNFTAHCVVLCCALCLLTTLLFFAQIFITPRTKLCDLIQGYELQFMMLYSEECVCVYLSVCLSWEVGSKIREERNEFLLIFFLSCVFNSVYGNNSASPFSSFIWCVWVSVRIWCKGQKKALGPQRLEV